LNFDRSDFPGVNLPSRTASRLFRPRTDSFWPQYEMELFSFTKYDARQMLDANRLANILRLSSLRLEMDLSLPAPPTQPRRRKRMVGVVKNEKMVEQRHSSVAHLARRFTLSRCAQSSLFALKPDPAIHFRVI
jgi:hypothetical protein